MDETVNKLEIGSEDLKRGGQGWYKRKWKAIRKGTWSIYTLKPATFKFLGLMFSYAGNTGAWALDGSWRNKRFDIRLDLIWIEINLWIKWDFTAIIQED